MRGVQFLTDYQGKKIAALVHINEHSAFWEEVKAEYSEIPFQFLIDRDGVKISVVIDFENHSELGEDIYDILTIEERQSEPRISWETVNSEIQSKEMVNV